MSNIPIRVLYAFLVGMVLLHASFILAQSSSAQISGSIAYHERIALPADAAIDIQLQDVSIADLAAQVVAETMINAEGRQVPIPFTLSYDPAQIDPSHRYSVRATIRSGDGMLMFTTAQAYPVLTHGAPSKVSLMLRTIGRGPKPGAAIAKQKPSGHAAEPAATSPEPKAASEAAPATAALTAGTGPPPTPRPEATKQSESPPQEEDKAVPQAAEAAAAPSEQKPVSTAPPTAQPKAEAVTEPTLQPATPNQPDKSPGTEADKSAPQSEQSSVASNEQPQPSATIPAVAPEQSPATQPPPASVEAKQPETTADNSKADIAEPQPSQPESKPAEPPAQEENKPAEKQEPLPDSPSTVAKLTAPEAPAEPAPEATPANPAPEPEPDSVPARPKADTPLADTQWKLVQLGGVQVVIQAPSRPMTLAFSPEGKRIAGSAGCHSYIGTFIDDYGRLTLNPDEMAAMGCAEPLIKREQKFIATMRDSDGYRITGDYLVLTSKGKIVAKFKNQLAP